MAGLAADGRQIVARAKSEAASYERLAPYTLENCVLQYFFPFLSLLSFSLKKKDRKKEEMTQKMQISLISEVTKLLVCSFYRVYGEPIPVKELADRVASYVHLCTLYWWLR